MINRREFLGTVSAASCRLHRLRRCPDGRWRSRSCARGTATPLEGHFHPKGKAPSKLHAGDPAQGEGRPALRRHARLRRAEEGPHRADAGPEDHGRCRSRRLGHGAVPVPRRAGRVRQHPSLAAAQSRLNNNYGLYEVIPGIYQVRGVRPLRHHLRARQDRLDRVRPAGQRRAGARRVEAVPEACRRGPAGHRR